MKANDLAEKIKTFRSWLHNWEGQTSTMSAANGSNVDHVIAYIVLPKFEDIFGKGSNAIEQRSVHID